MTTLLTRRHSTTVNVTSPSVINFNLVSTDFPAVTEDDINTFLNKRACDIILPGKLKTVLEWGSNKLPHETFWQFLESKIDPTLWNKHRKRWTKDDESKLQQKKPDGFDATLLVKLIPEACDQISFSGTHIWTLNDESRAECLLKKLKNLRNAVMHEPIGGAVSTNSMREMERLLVQLIKVAGSLFHISQDTIDKEIDSLRTAARALKNTTLSSKEKRMIQVQRRLITDGFKEMTMKFLHHTNVLMPIGKRKISLTDVFHMIKLSPENDLDNRQRVSMPCSSLFEEINNRLDGRFIIVDGIPGSGKSTLLRRIAQDFLKIGRKIFSGLDSYDLLLFIECRNPSLKCLSDLLRLMYSKSLEKIEISDAEDACHNLKKLILIDGLDEMNENSRALVLQLVILFGHQIENATFVVTSRPHAANTFARLLNEENIKRHIYKIQSIERLEEQLSFLEKYQRLVVTKPQLLTKTYKSLDSEVHTHFTTPIHLALFCDAFQHSNGEMHKWTSESGAMRETFNLCRVKMNARLDQDGVTDSNLVSKIILSSVCKISLYFLVRDEFHIEKGAFEDLCLEVQDRVRQKIDCNGVMSCIWSPRYSFHDYSDISYEFFHKSHQEYMASKFIVDFASKNPQLSVTQIIENVTEIKLTDQTIKK